MKDKLLQAVNELESWAKSGVNEFSTQIDKDEMEVKVNAFILREYINEKVFK